MNKQAKLEASPAEDTKKGVVLATLPKLWFLSSFQSAKVTPDHNGFRLENSIP